MNSISVRATLSMSWPIEGRCSLPRPPARRFLDEDGIDLLQRSGIAVTGQNQLRRIKLADLFEFIAEGLADPHRLTAILMVKWRMSRADRFRAARPVAPTRHFAWRCGKASTFHIKIGGEAVRIGQALAMNSKIGSLIRRSWFWPVTAMPLR